MIPGREVPGARGIASRIQPGDPAGRPQERHRPAGPADPGGSLGHVRREAAVQPGHGRANRPTIGGGRDEGGAVSHAADRDRLDPSLRGGVAKRRTRCIDEGGPPSLRVLLGPTGLSVQQKVEGHAGPAQQSAVEGDDRDLEGGRAQVDGDDGAGAGGGHARIVGAGAALCRRRMRPRAVRGLTRAGRSGRAPSRDTPYPTERRTSGGGDRHPGRSSLGRPPVGGWNHGRSPTRFGPCPVAPVR